MNTYLYWRFWIISYFLLACIKHRVFPLRYFYVNLKYTDKKTGIYSKYELNNYIPEEYKLRTSLLHRNKTIEEWQKIVTNNFTYPLFLKPEWGQASKGVYCIEDKENLLPILKKIQKYRLNYICQQGASGKNEYDILYVRNGNTISTKDVYSFTRSDKKSIVGDGASSIQELIQEKYPNGTKKELLSDHGSSHILKRNEELLLSSINGTNSDTIFTNQTPEISKKSFKKVLSHVQKISDFPLARISMSADSIKDLEKGLFEVIEVNLYTPMPLNLLDTTLSKREKKQNIQRYTDQIILTAKNTKSQKNSFSRLIQLIWKQHNILATHF